MGERRVTADGRILERMPDGSIVEVGRQGGAGQTGTLLPEAPPAPQQAPVRTEAGGATEGLKPGFMWVDPNNPAAGQVQIPTAPNPEAPQNRERQAQIKTILGNIQRLRGMADEPMAVGSAAEFFQGTPFLNQNVRNVQASLKQIQGDLIQQQVALLAQANQGGVASLANSASEAERMAASIAALGESQSVPEFLKGLEDAENYYLRQAATIEGKPAPDDATLAQYLPEARRKELTATPAEQQMGLATDGTTNVPIPPAMQQAFTRYLIENKDNLDPSQYAAFRNQLAEQYGFAPVPITDSVANAQKFNEFFRSGGTPEAIPLVGPERETSTLENLANRAAMNPVGAATASFSNSALAGLPAYLSGNTEQMEAVRQNSPVASFAGDIAGGVAGSLSLGGIAPRLGVRFAQNPLVQDAMFGAVSGATQSEDPLLGAAVGLGSALGGDFLGRQFGRALPDAFAPGAMREATESVPTSGELGNQADRMYRAAAANGEMIQPAQTNQFIDDTETFLRQNGYMTQQGDILGTGPVQDATRLLQSFRDQPIGPMEAQTLRQKIADGRLAMREGAPDNQARMFSGQMTDNFDQFAEAQNALPGIGAAREVGQRRILGRQMDQAAGVGDFRGQVNYSQGGEDLGLRRAFGNLDLGEIRGQRQFPPEVSDAIQKVSRGTPFRNAMQFLGRAAPVTGVGASAPLGLGTIAGVGTSDPITGLVTAATVGGAGLFGRSLSNRMTRRDAEMASLVARGGPQFQSMLRQAEEEAAMRAGRIGAGAFGSAAIMPMRD